MISANVKVKDSMILFKIKETTHINSGYVLLAHLSRRLMGVLNSIPVTPVSVRQHFQTFSALKPLGQLNSNFIWRLLRMRERNFFKWSWSHGQDGRHAHIWLKPFKNLLLQNQKVDDLGNWHVAFGMWGLPSLFKS